MSADEFDTIARLFAPLAGEGARGLLDDAAVIGAREGLVLTTDSIVENVHFFSDDPIDTVAQKALRVSLSDLAGKGARPLGVLVALMWPNDRPASEIEMFARGLAADLREFNVALLGGDTTSIAGPLAINVTAIGAPLGARTPARADARIDDDLWVTGTIGDSVLGLNALHGEAFFAGARTYVVTRYRLPSPRLAFAPAIASYAHAAMDVSDGLIVDAAKMAAASGLAFSLDPEAIPLSPIAQTWAAKRGDRMPLLYGGDDYELLFTAAPSARDAIAAAGAAIDLPVTRIGRAVAGAGLIDPQGAPIAVLGHSHQLGR